MGKKLFIFMISVVILLASCTNQETVNIKPTNSLQTTKEPERTESIVTPKPKMSFSGEELNVQYIRTNGYMEGREYPMAIIIKSQDELYDYYKSNKRYNTFMKSYDYRYVYNENDFIETIEKYNKDYFDNNILLFVLMEEGSGSCYHKVNSVTRVDDRLDIEYDVICPECCTADMAEWHIVIEIPNSMNNVCEFNFMRGFKGVNIPKSDYKNITITSGDTAIQPYEFITYSKTYDETTGRRSTKKVNKQDLKDLVMNVLEIKLDCELELFAPCGNINNITIYNEFYEECGECEKLYSGMLAGYKKGIYYVDITHEHYGKYIDIAKKSNYCEGHYLFKLVLTDDVYGLQESFKEICDIDVWEADKVELKVLSDTQDGDKEYVTISDGEGLRQFVDTLRISKLLINECEPIKRDSSQCIVLYKDDVMLAEIEQTQNGIYIKSNNMEYYMELAPWGFERMIQAITGCVICPKDVAIDVTREELIERGYIDSKEYKHIAQLQKTEYGAEWIVTFYVPQENDEELEIYTTIVSEHLYSIHTNQDNTY